MSKIIKTSCLSGIFPPWRSFFFPLNDPKLKLAVFREPVYDATGLPCSRLSPSLGRPPPHKPLLPPLAELPPSRDPLPLHRECLLAFSLHTERSEQHIVAGCVFDQSI